LRLNIPASYHFESGRLIRSQTEAWLNLWMALISTYKQIGSRPQSLYVRPELIIYMVAIKFVGVPTRDFVPFNKVPDKETAIKSSCRNLVTFVYPNPKKLGGGGLHKES